MERIGIYGGTFNPPHIGHVRGAAFAREALGLTKLLVVPAGIAPHKAMPPDSPTPEQRWAMAKLAAGEIPGGEASNLEIFRGETAYTWQTVAALRREHPEAKLYFLLGEDMFLTFLNWRCPERILENAALAVLCRGERDEKTALEKQARAVEAMGGEVVLLKNPVTEISSTDLRRMLAFRCAGPFLPEHVGAYIETNGLYAVGKDLRGLPEEALERTVVSLLKPSRVAHVRGCRDAAVKLARRWGANERDAARAALLHDVTKALPGTLQLTLCREYGIVLDKFSGLNPKTLHALTGSLVAERIFGENAAVVSAIASHTTGKADMDLLEKIIYVADYMEPNRDFPGVERLRELADTDITKALRLGLEMTLDMLKKQGREISPGSAAAIRYLDETGVRL